MRLTLGSTQQFGGVLTGNFGRCRNPVRRIVDATDQQAEFFDRIVDRIGNRTGDVFADRRGRRQVAISQIAQFVHQLENGLLVFTIGHFRSLTLRLGIFGTAPRIIEIDLGQQGKNGNRKHCEADQKNHEAPALGQDLLVAKGEIVRRFQQIFTVAENAGTGLLGKNKRLHVAEDAADSRLIGLERSIELAEFFARVGVGRPLAQTQQDVPEVVGILAQQEGHFRVDFIADQQGRGILGDPLRQHHHLVRRSNFLVTGTRLQLERGNLLRQFQHCRIFVINRRHVFAEGKQIFLLPDNDLGVIVGFRPQGGQCLKLGPDISRRCRNFSTVDIAPGSQHFKQMTEGFARILQLRESGRITL